MSLLKMQLSFTRMAAWALQRKFRKAGLVHKSVQLSGANVSYWEGGEGPPLIMLHGFGASALWQWHLQVPALAERFRLVVPDLPYFGESTAISGPRTLSFESQMVTELLDHLGLDVVDIMGLSYGGMVGMLMAAERPNRVRRLVLSASPGGIMNSADYNAMLERFDVDHISQLLLPTGPKGVRRLMRVAWRKPPWVPGFALGDIYRQLFTDQLSEKTDLLADLLTYLDAPPFDANQLTQPTLLLWGEHDPIFPVEIGRRLNEALGGRVELHVFENAAHATNLEQADRFNQLATEFLQRP